MIEAEIVPELALRSITWELFLGMPIHQVIEIFKRLEGTISSVDLWYSEKSPFNYDILLHLPNDGLKLHFEPMWQRLKLIEITDLTKISLTYLSHQVNASNKPPSLSNIINVFGSTKQLLTDEESGLYRLCYRGLTFLAAPSSSVDVMGAAGLSSNSAIGTLVDTELASTSVDEEALVVRRVFIFPGPILENVQAVVNISAYHMEDPGSLPGCGVDTFVNVFIFEVRGHSFNLRGADWPMHWLILADKEESLNDVFISSKMSIGNSFLSRLENRRKKFIELPPELPASCYHGNVFLERLNVVHANDRTVKLCFDLVCQDLSSNPLTDPKVHRFSSALTFGDTAQDVLSALGSPSRVFYKTEDKMSIHLPQTYRQSRQSRCDYFYNYFTLGLDVLFDSRTHRVISFILHTNQPGEYTFNISCSSRPLCKNFYWLVECLRFGDGLLVTVFSTYTLLHRVDDTERPFKLSSCLQHLLFVLGVLVSAQYFRCMFEIPLTIEAADGEAKVVTITPFVKVQSLLNGVLNESVVIHRETPSRKNPFGPTNAYNYRDLIFEPFQDETFLNSDSINSLKSPCKVPDHVTLGLWRWKRKRSCEYKYTFCARTHVLPQNGSLASVTIYSLPDNA
ncbi:hypothetical protein ACTXT7_007676 [Hymenolepis weldensis]